jgi:hypothetical protein
MNRGGLSPRRDQIDLFGRMNTSTSGTITTQTKKKFSGFVAARTGVGLYTLTVDRTAARYNELLDFAGKLYGAAFAAGKGLVPICTVDALTTTGILTMQFVNDAGAITGEIPDGASVLWSLTLSLSASTVG